MTNNLKPSKPSKKPRVAQTSDGYFFTEQTDGTWTDGDMTFDSLTGLLQSDPDTLVDGMPVAGVSSQTHTPRPGL